MKRTLIAIIILILGSIHAEAFYDDVKSDNQYFESIKSLYDLQMLPEEANNLFRPDEKLKKPDLYKFILSFAKAQLNNEVNLPYNDTDNSAEYAPYLQTAIDNQLIHAYGNSTFGINDTVTKHFALTKMFETLGVGINHFLDKASFPYKDIGVTGFIAPVAQKAWDLDIKEVNDPNKFYLTKRITRAEAADYLYKIYTGSNSRTITIKLEQEDPATNLSQSEKKLIDNENFQIFLDVWSNIQDNYYYQNNIDDKNLINGAIKGIVDRLSDKYTVFEEPLENSSLSVLSDEYEGIGTVLELIDNKIMIIAPFPDSPAEKAGIKANDQILEIDDEDMTEKTLDYAANKIRGVKNSEVNLTILRDGNTIYFKVKRDFILLNSVKQELLEHNGKKIGYIKILNFGEKTYQEFVDSAKKLILQKPAGFIVDLRNNPGGYLDIAVDIVGLFTNEKKTAVTLKLANNRKEEYKTDGNGLLKDYKTIILINNGSASASEIMAGALQDFKIAKLIGTTSFGKGSAQEIRRYNNGSLFKYTISEWLTPNDRIINKIGLTPDKVVINQTTDAQLKAAKEEF